MMALYQLTLGGLMIIYNLVVSSIPVCNLELAFCHHHHNAATTGDSVQSSNLPMQTHFKELKTQKGHQDEEEMAKENGQR